jgi:hypothetical protein
VHTYRLFPLLVIYVRIRDRRANNFLSRPVFSIKPSSVRHVLHVCEAFFPYYSEQLNIDFDLALGFYDMDEPQSFISIEKAPK